jgi:nicotinamidase-related amidase
MQEGIARRATNCADLLVVIPRITSAARRAGIPVVYSRHTSLPAIREDRVRLRQQLRTDPNLDPARVNSRYQIGSPEWQFVPELAPEPSDIVLPKFRLSFFVGTPLQTMLASWQTDVIVLTGVALNHGIVATARDALNLGIFPIVCTDAVGAYSASEHDKGLREVAESADLCTSGQLLSQWMHIGPS